MSEPSVLLAVDKRGVATVTLNRPAVNNAYNGEIVQNLLDGCERLAGDAAVRVVVIRGNGRHFQAGADLNWLKQISHMDAAANLEISRRTALAMRRLNEMPKPTIALVHGACVGGGTGIVASCDIVIASRDATFAITEARWGVIASIIFPQLNAAIGIRNVRRYALSCERFGAEQAQAIGLVHEVCETGALDDALTPMLEGLLHAAPTSIRESKLSAMRCAGSIMSDAEFERLVAQHASKRQSDEATEGLTSFIEKRDPIWYPAG
ncbi:MAG: enoyl-CoA hydratase/isomerase family protein [Burkholderiales bacterium]|nr:enoyl-CoA hydratase/isomerase family protein [Burkholderiales bacterium]